ncbi:NO-inducible flavohemoprotein [Aquabacterium sp. A7-Y]|uniref:NO-inducible flavohemoprotein n=1 Tax=Aquabacterium sp. A7-Y TaxID=1349605 RepID=UPI00223D5697|nr:NO-inducible flavohemoprotein [Aquabacterium sp. A7-Y]MCW7536879.1 NO-inducible flavohemoprotein [Aquabacterium sp. A7-Y]
MLSEQTIRLVKATVPVLQQHGEAITAHFYPLMFRTHPEVKSFFNEAHQAEGTQARALARAVLAYATHIDRLDALVGELPRIVQKHVSLGVAPEHYPVVGRCLLAAIKEVLGDAATDDIMAAWAEAYGALADLLIAAESQVYRDKAAQPGGWQGTRSFRVARKQAESELITSFYLEPADGGPLLAFQPGQYLTLVLTLDGETLRRNYSLSDAPGKPCYRISVKREEGGRVSTWLHDHAEAGTELQVQPPCGDFVLDPEAPRERRLLLVTGGVGITPAVSMLEAAAPTGRPIHFVHAARHGGVHAFRARVEQLVEQHRNVRAVFIYEQPRAQDRADATGRLTRALLARELPADRDVDLYFLGPKPFMQAVHDMALALQVPAQRLRYEFFGPRDVFESAAGEQGTPV